MLTAGAVISAACFALGIVLRLLMPEAASRDPRELELVLQSASELQPWAWSTLGVMALLATPAAGLIATALELQVRQPRVALLALAVLGLLAVAALLALAGG